MLFGHELYRIVGAAKGTYIVESKWIDARVEQYHRNLIHTLHNSNRQHLDLSFLIRSRTSLLFLLVINKQGAPERRW